MTTERPDPLAPVPDDAGFDAAWRAASREEPPASVDAAIRAAARRAVAAGPRPADVPEATRPERWWWPLAAAATIGAVAVGVLQVIGPEAGRDAPAGAPAVVSDMPTERSAPSASPTRVKPPAAAVTPRAPSPATVRPPAPRVETAAAPPAKPSSSGELSTVPMAAPAPTPAPAAPAPPRDAGAMRDQIAEPFPAGSPAPMAKRASEPSTAPAPARQSAAPLAGAAKAERAAPRPPLSVPEWITRIRALRAEGRDEEAAKEIAAFRLAHPDLDPERLLAEAPHAAAPTDK